jgi:hypothetical protein
LTCLTNILLGYREKEEKNLDEILNSYNYGNIRNYENINPSYSQTPHYYAIIVLGGGLDHTPYRVKEGIKAFKQGIAKYLIVTAGKDDAPIAEEIIKNAGINEYIVDDRSKTTLYNALYAKEILRNLHAPKDTLVAILTEEPHCDRAIDTFNLIFRGKYGINAICIEPLPDPYMWGKEEKIKHIRKYISPLYPLLINFLTYSEKYLSYLPGMNEEKAEKMVNEFIRSTSDIISYLFNTTLKYANKVREYINKVIGSYRSYVYTSSSS